MKSHMINSMSILLLAIVMPMTTLHVCSVNRQQIDENFITVTNILNFESMVTKWINLKEALKKLYVFNISVSCNGNLKTMSIDYMQECCRDQAFVFIFIVVYGLIYYVRVGVNIETS